MFVLRDPNLQSVNSSPFPVPDVDRCNLEKHLSDADFEMAFNVNRDEFYSLPLWKRNDLKRRVRLF